MSIDIRYRIYALSAYILEITCTLYAKYVIQINIMFLCLLEISYVYFYCPV